MRGHRIEEGFVAQARAEDAVRALPAQNDGDDDQDDEGEADEYTVIRAVVWRSAAELLAQAGRFEEAAGQARRAAAAYRRCGEESAAPEMDALFDRARSHTV